MPPLHLGLNTHTTPDKFKVTELASMEKLQHCMQPGTWLEWEERRLLLLARALAARRQV